MSIARKTKETNMRSDYMPLVKSCDNLRLLCLKLYYYCSVSFCFFERKVLLLKMNKHATIPGKISKVKKSATALQYFPASRSMECRAMVGVLLSMFATVRFS